MKCTVHGALPDRKQMHSEDNTIRKSISLNFLSNTINLESISNWIYLEQHGARVNVTRVYVEGSGKIHGRSEL